MNDGDSVDTLIALLRKNIDFAFQPIVNIHSGNVYGFEALIRGQERLGFSTIQALTDVCFGSAKAVLADDILCDKAITRFASFAAGTDAKLFYNLDGRVLRRLDHSLSTYLARLERAELAPSALCVEISEKAAALDYANAAVPLRSSAGGVMIVADDFGTGQPGLHLLFQNPPDLIKVDRSFISGIAEDPRKRLFLSSIVGLAQALGVRVVALGVETEAEFTVCRDVGCELVQGYFIARPTTETTQLRHTYPVVTATNRAERRMRKDASLSLRSELDYVQPLSINSDMNDVFAAFRQERARSLFPVIDEAGQPLGLLHDHDLKEFTYSPFGKDLIANRGTKFKMRHFLRQCLTFDINTPLDRILAGYAAHAKDPAILIIEDGKYVGLLQASSLLRLMNDQQLALARNENPLTRLPGNLTINDYIFHAFEDTANDWAFAYFDFDYFKPFNDVLGFRNGDRAILMFADLLRKAFPEREAFPAHIGGDDFFLGIRGPERHELEMRVQALIETFTHDAASFYDIETQRRGHMDGIGRNGEKASFPLLSISCALVTLPEGLRGITPDDLALKLARLKKQAKLSPQKFALWNAV